MSLLTCWWNAMYVRQLYLSCHNFLYVFHFERNIMYWLWPLQKTTLLYMKCIFPLWKVSLTDERKFQKSSFHCINTFSRAGLTNIQVFRLKNKYYIMSEAIHSSFHMEGKYSIIFDNSVTCSSLFLFFSLQFTL